MCPWLPKDAWPNSANLNLYTEAWQSVGLGLKASCEWLRATSRQLFGLAKVGTPMMSLSLWVAGLAPRRDAVGAFFCVWIGFQAATETVQLFPFRWVPGGRAGLRSCHFRVVSQELTAQNVFEALSLSLNAKSTNACSLRQVGRACSFGRLAPCATIDPTT